MNVVDLTHPLNPQAPSHEGDPPVTLARAASHATDGYQVTAVGLGSHSGTHLDAPRHFFPGGATLDDYPVDRLVRPGWVLDVRPQRPQALVGAALLGDKLQEAHLEAGDFLLLWTGGAVLAEDCAVVLLECGAGLVGTDAPSLDDHPYPIHQVLLGEGVLLAENLANLDHLGTGRVMCAFLPLAIPEADGAPVRAVAWR